MFVPYPSSSSSLLSTPNADPFLPSIHSHLTQGLHHHNNNYHNYQEQDRARTRVEARASKLARQTRPQHHRRSSKKFLTSTSTEIYGDWDITAKSEPRLQAKAKSKGPIKGVRQGAATTAPTMTTIPVASDSNNNNYMDGPGTNFPPPPPVHGQSVSLNATPSTAPYIQPARQATTSEGSHKPKPSFSKDIRRTPSANAVVSSNATTSWTVGQQNIQNSINLPSSAHHNTASSPLALASPATTTMVRPTLMSRESEGGLSEGTSVGTQDPLSAKSKFMRVLNKFKGKHLHKGYVRFCFFVFFRLADGVPVVMLVSLRFAVVFGHAILHRSMLITQHGNLSVMLIPENSSHLSFPFVSPLLPCWLFTALLGLPQVDRPLPHTTASHQTLSRTRPLLSYRPRSLASWSLSNTPTRAQQPMPPAQM